MSLWRLCGSWKESSNGWPGGECTSQEPGTGHTVRGPRAHLPALPAHRLSPTYPARGRRVSRCPAGGCRSLSPHIVLTGSSRLHPLSISGAIPAWSSPQRASVASRPSLSGVQSLHTASVNILGPHRFCKNVFNRDYKATIGVDFEIERFEVAGIPFSLQIWDTAGQEKFKCIASAYYRGAQVIIVAFDLTDVQTLAHTRQWLEDALRENEPGACFLFLVGTKKDLLSGAVMEQVEAEAVRLANEMQAEYWSVSAKTGENVKAFFSRVAALTFERSVLQDLEQRSRAWLQVGDGDLIRMESRLPDTQDSTRPSSLGCC
uniref:Ras-related protein Rab-36 n=1 Tax=Catagonus wagneri TaxID=51154 RepID=A0A8C3WEN7_9CETA